MYIATNVSTACIYTNVFTKTRGPTQSGPKLIQLFVFCCALACRICSCGCGNVAGSFSEARVTIMTFIDSLYVGGEETSFDQFKADGHQKLLDLSLLSCNLFY